MKKICSIILGIFIFTTMALPAVAVQALPSANYMVLNNLLNQIQTQIFSYISPLTNVARNLFGYLIVIDLVLAYILNFRNTDYLQLLVIKILKYGGIYWVIINYNQIINWTISGFIWLGLAGGSTATGLQLISNPTEFSNIAVAHGTQIFSKSVIIATPGIGGIYIFFGILIFLAMIFIATNFIVTYISFYILAILSLGLIPFGANKFTSAFAGRVVNMLFAFGVKIMVLAFLAAVSIPILKNWNLPNFNILNPGAFIPSLLYLSAGSIVLAVLSWHAPSLAASLLNGSTPLHAGNFFSGVMAPVKSVASVSHAATGISKAVNAVSKVSSSSGQSALANATKLKK